MMLPSNVKQFTQKYGILLILIGMCIVSPFCLQPF
jgi:hypothetical protein